MRTPEESYLVPDADKRIFASYNPADPTVWRLESAYCRATSLGLIAVPAGFVWNGCSIPRALWGLLPPWGSYSGAALIHDWLYSKRQGHRSDADRVLLELLIEDKIQPEIAMLFYRSVRVFGAEYWNELLPAAEV
jgi:hypothetical protein